VQRVWKAFALAPHRQKHFKLSTDPFFVEKVRDIVGLYPNPPDNAMVLCVDEKSQVQALDRTQPMLALGLGNDRPDLGEYATDCVIWRVSYMCNNEGCAAEISVDHTMQVQYHGEGKTLPEEGAEIVDTFPGGREREANDGDKNPEV